MCCRQGVLPRQPNTCLLHTLFVSARSNKVSSRCRDSWEIIEGLKGNPGNIQEPEKQEGFLLKRRKWPMKGWQKRYFLLEKGILKYSKRGADKGKLHGCIDVGLSVMSIKKKTKAIDLDTNDNIYHLKVTLSVSLSRLSSFILFLSRFIISLFLVSRFIDLPDGSRPLVHQVSNESRASIPESMSEFFDAQEYQLTSSSSENEDLSSFLCTSILRPAPLPPLSPPAGSGGSGVQVARRRTTLPSPQPSSSSVSLWNILKNNIGKDLSKVAMPVQLNEPLNTLQRLCEEVEYSELLDTANHTQDPYQRMVYVATFAVSAYASSYHRAGSKPFNPILGETYECDRPDKGFRFIAEQVSHHPPVSACHCDSNNFTFWQDVQWKNKFWGKSMEIVRIGTTHVTLPAFGDHYEWNKVTSCIHNILSGQRWIEHYGEMSIKNTSSDACQCKVTFVKARSWSSTVNEIEGMVTDTGGRVIHTFFGKWHEGVYQGVPPSAICIWRANPMPVDQDQYYGFTQFAVELNELDAALKPLLPPTDTRYRLDQRCLEEGNIEGAEEQKRRIEELQRGRRKVLEENNVTHKPRFFKYATVKSKDDTWLSSNVYWEQRKNPRFSREDFPVLW
uniref:Oxysterol-binding protein n=1 Tax=Oncorhynchus tshawytscha TaxID=74940 RepID=A0AAZ3PCD9_ONCTS